MTSHASHFEIDHAPTWCPGCGDFAIWRALKQALAAQNLEPHQCAVSFGIGCSGNMADKLRAYGFHGLHGRALPVAEGIKLANHRLPVVVVGGDGDGYGEGVQHLVHAMRANHDLTYVVHNNSVYGLTKGQASPTSEQGTKSSSTPAGSPDEPLNPMALAIASDATFVARAFAADVTELTELLQKAMAHRGFALVDIFQPCVTFNDHNTYDWYRKRIYRLEEEGYEPTDRKAAFAKALEWGDRIPVGIFYQQEERPAFHEELPQLAAGPLVERPLGATDLRPLYKDFL